MARPHKPRRICLLPKNLSLVPGSAGTERRTALTMTLDEFETIRLIDIEGLSQEECARRMNVARTTAQAIYNNARHRLALCLVEGRELQVCGGCVRLCSGGDEGCGLCRDKTPK